MGAATRWVMTAITPIKIKFRGVNSAELKKCILFPALLEPRNRNVCGLKRILSSGVGGNRNQGNRDDIPDIEINHLKKVP
jgi:hypothetical protein